MIKIHLKNSLDAYHRQVKLYNRGKPLTEQIRTAEVYTGEMIIRTHCDIFNKGSTDDYYLFRTSQNSMCTLMKIRSKNTIKAHFTALMLAGIILTRKTKKSYLLQLELSPEVVKFEEQKEVEKPLETVENRIKSGKLKLVKA